MYFIYASTILITGLHVLNIINKKQVLFKPHPVILPLLLFLFSQILSTLFSLDHFTSFYGYYGRFNGGLLSTVCFVLLFLIYNTYRTNQTNAKIINISIISGLLVSLYAIAQHFGIDKSIWQQDVQARVFSTLGQPNWLAAYMCILIPLSIHMGIRKPIYFISTILFALSLLFTKSQSGIIASAISIAIITLYNLKNKKIYILNLVFLFLLFLIPNPIYDKFFPAKSTDQPILKPETGEVLNITGSDDIRKIVWSGAVELTKRYPIFGTGPETFAQTYYWVRPREHNDTSEWNFLYNKAHNEYLNLSANTGLFGLLTYFAIIITSIFIFIKSRSWALLSSFSTIIITNFFGFSISVVSLYFFFLVLLCHEKS